MPDKPELLRKGIGLPSEFLLEVRRFAEERLWDDNLMRKIGLRISADDTAELILSSYANEAQ